MIVFDYQKQRVVAEVTATRLSRDTFCRFLKRRYAKRKEKHE